MPRSSSYFVTARPHCNHPSFSFCSFGVSNSPLFCCPLLPPDHLPPLLFSSFLHVIVVLSSVSPSHDPLNLPLPFHFLEFHTFFRHSSLSFFSPLCSPSVVVVLARACQVCNMLGGRDVNLDALPSHPGFTFDWSVFIDSVLFSSTRFAKFLFNISLASGVPVRFCGANGNASLIIRFFFDVVGIVVASFLGLVHSL